MIIEILKAILIFDLTVGVCFVLAFAATAKPGEIVLTIRVVFSLWLMFSAAWWTVIAFALAFSGY